MGLISNLLQSKSLFYNGKENPVRSVRVPALNSAFPWAMILRGRRLRPDQASDARAPAGPSDAFHRLLPRPVVHQGSGLDRPCVRSCGCAPHYRSRVSPGTRCDPGRTPASGNRPTAVRGDRRTSRNRQLEDRPRPRRRLPCSRSVRSIFRVLSRGGRRSRHWRKRA